MLSIPVIWGQETVTDIDGNVYETVQIGDQLWMKENLKVTHYRNGDEIPTGYGNFQWGYLTTGAYTSYNNDPDIAEIYGNLYNWYAVDDGRGVCPEGWHVQSDDEIKQLEMNLGMSEEEANSTSWRGTNEGSKLAGMADLWMDGSLENDPEFGDSDFNFLPGGYRSNFDGFYNIGINGVFWSSTEHSNSWDAWFRQLNNNSTGLYRNIHGKGWGLSVRCLKDEPETGTILIPQDYPTIQAGIDVASDGDTVLVSPGTYWENINYLGKDIIVGSYYLIDANEDYINSTIIYGGGFYGNAPTVLIENGESSSAFLTGFTISGGRMSGVRVNDSNPTLTHLNIIANYGNGGIFLFNSNSHLEHLFVSDNTLIDMYHGGAGIFSQNSIIVVRNSIITNNWAGHGGWTLAPAGIDGTSSELLLDKITMYGNSGGSIILKEGSLCTIINSVIWNYSHDDDYTNFSEIKVLGQTGYGGSSDLTISYSDLYGGQDGVSGEGTVNWLEGNINEYPFFCQPNNNDFTLADNSPCIASGDDGVNMGALDIGCGSINYSADYNSDWNMVGIPFEMDDSQYQSIFPDAVIGTLYSFNGSYEQSENLESSIGYLLRLENGGEYFLEGNPLFEVVVFLSEGWNIISGPVIDVSSEDLYESEAVVPGTIYGFNGTYFSADVLESGKGYWVRSTGSAYIQLPSTEYRTKIIQEDENKEILNSLVVGNDEFSSTLYFGGEIQKKDELSFSLPPKFFGMAFDVRFLGDMKYTLERGEIEVVNTTETLTLSYDITVEAGEYMNWVLTSEIGEEYILDGVGETTVPSAERFLLKRKPVIPITFALHKNFPNPFNPITTLRYDLPSDALVTLSIYDMLGKEITQLVNTNQQAGFKSVQWDATDSMGKSVSAGVYLYQIQAGEFVQTKKMVLLK